MKKSSKSDAGFQRYRLKRPFLSQKGGFLGPKPTWGGVTKNFWVERTSKMNSAPSNYSECKFSAKSDNF